MSEKSVRKVGKQLRLKIKTKKIKKNTVNICGTGNKHNRFD